MSYSASPPASQKPLPYPSYQSAGSPTAQSPYGAQPPAKRQRLSPDARSPNGTPNYATSPHGLPTTGYGNPYGAQGVQSPYSPSSFTGSPHSGFNTPQPYQQQQQTWPVQTPSGQPRPSQTSPPPPASSRDMPPPPRPNKDDKDEKANIEDIGDSLFMSGINLKEEENYLHGIWNNRPANESFVTNGATSFGSTTLASNNNSFNMLTQSTSFGSQGTNGPLAGTMGQPRSQEDIENETRRRREAAARKKAEHEQSHLNNQFLLGNCLRHRMHRLAMDNAVRLDVQGVYLRNPDPRPPKVMVGGGEGIIETKPESMIEAGASYESILSLISLATGERLRGLVDEAYGLARARQYGDHGLVVPPEFSDIAQADGQKTQESVIPESVTGTQWDKAHVENEEKTNGEPLINGQKETPQPAQTISFQGALNIRLREIAERDRAAEKERSRRREARKRKADMAGDEATPSGTPADTPAASGSTEPAAPKLTKKEITKKEKEAKAAEAQSSTASNMTARMMVMGTKKQSKYSWMTGSGGGMPSNRYAKPSGGSGTATPKAQPDMATKVATAAKQSETKVPTWGDWREDSVDGRGIQLRDWTLVLERDGREKKALQKAVNKLH